MNILLLAEVSASAVLGGAERVLREQALGLRKHGHHVTVVARAPSSDSRPRIVVGDVVEHRYIVSRRNELAFALSSVVRSIKGFDQARALRSPDAVIIHQALAGFGAILRYRAQAHRWIYMCLSLAHEEYLSRTPPPTTALDSLRRTLNTAVRRWIERLVMNRCARVVVLSQFMWDRVLAVHRISEDKLRMVTGAADPDRFRPPEDPVAVRGQLKLPLNRVVLFTVRNLVPRMGLENLLDAIATLGEEGGDLLLVIGGEGPLRPALEQRIRDLGLSDRARLVGFIAEDDLSRYYQAADLVLMPTHQLEGFGLVTVEALACGTPVLGTPVGAIPEVLARVDPGLLAEGANGAALATAIRRILCRFRDHPGEQERLSVKGRALVEQDYTWDRHSEQLDRVLREVCLTPAGSSAWTRPCKVIHVITRLDRGGSAQNTLLTALGQDRSRFIPMVVAGLPGRWDAQGGMAATEENCCHLEKAGVRWQLLPTLTREVNLLKDLATLWILVVLFRQERPAIVHTHTSKAGALGRLAAWVTRMPVVIHTPHGHVFYGHFGSLLSWMFLQAERLLATHTTRMIALTEAERDDHLLRQVGCIEHFAVVPSGIDLERFRRSVGVVGGHPEGFDCPPDALVVGSVGWLTPIKGHRFLIEAFARLKPSYPRLHLVILGSGELRDELAAQAVSRGVGESVRFLGERSDVPNCLEAMNLFILPSLNEGMGRALIEAMAAGRPVIATKVGGIPAIVEHGRTGLLVPPGDATALAAAMAELLRRPDWAKELGAAASERIGAEFGVSRMVQAVETVYEEALQATSMK